MTTVHPPCMELNSKSRIQIVHHKDFSLKRPTNMLLSTLLSNQSYPVLFPVLIITIVFHHQPVFSNQMPLTVSMRLPYAFHALLFLQCSYSQKGHRFTHCPPMETVMPSCCRLVALLQMLLQRHGALLCLKPCANQLLCKSCCMQT